MFIKLDDDNYITETLFIADGVYPDGFFEAGDLPEASEEYKYIGGEFVHEPRPEEVPEQEEVNAVSLKYLSDTDWYVTRYAETGATIPQEILDARAAARAAIVVQV
jgi:hypothetical protein